MLSYVDDKDEKKVVSVSTVSWIPRRLFTALVNRNTMVTRQLDT